MKPKLKLSEEGGFLGKYPVACVCVCARVCVCMCKRHLIRIRPIISLKHGTLPQSIIAENCKKWLCGTGPN